MKIAKFLVAFTVLILFTMFATANIHTVPIYSIWKGHSLLGVNKSVGTPDVNSAGTPKEMPVFLVIFVSFGLGFLIAGVMSFGAAVSQRSHVKRLKRELLQKDKELDKLRNIPLPDSSELDESHIPTLPIDNV